MTPQGKRHEVSGKRGASLSDQRLVATCMYGFIPIVCVLHPCFVRAFACHASDSQFGPVPQGCGGIVTRGWGLDKVTTARQRWWL